MPGPEQVLTNAQTRAAESALIATGVTEARLMDRAAGGVADWVWRIAAGRSITVLCGPGNNGGDGYVVARLLRERGARVRVVAPHPPRTDVARAARDRWSGATETTADGGVFVDCLFGAGLSRPLSLQDQRILADMAARHDTAIAVDLPSGVDGDSGKLLSPVPGFDHTLAIGAWKPGHFALPALLYLGERRLVRIGLPPVQPVGEVLPPPRFESPGFDAHKYARGMVGVVGGAMPGAALLAAQGAMRAGAGYVKLLSDSDGCGGPAALVRDDRPLNQALADGRYTALLAGPGLGRDPGARDRLNAVLDRGMPAVLDADALHLIDDDLIEGIDTARLLLTPHDGELAKLCDTFGIARGGKREQASALAERTGMTVLAKGADAVLASPGFPLGFFHPAPGWLASAGTGDVLAGIAAARLSAGGTPREVAHEAMHIHAEAARIMGTALIADDLANAVGKAYARFL